MGRTYDAIKELLPKNTQLTESVFRAAIGENLLPSLINTKNITDGYHTFDELYQHRDHLYMALATKYVNRSWKSKKHADGTMWPGYFVAGIYDETSKKAISYHLDIKYRDSCPGAVESKAPKRT